MDVTEQLTAFPVPIADTIEPAAAPIGKYAAHLGWLFLWGRRVAEYGFVQCWVQLLTAVAGLIIVRTLAKQDYALYAITNSMQSTCHLLSDVGIGIGVRSIGGRIWSDRRRLGELINTALGMRRLFAIFSIAACLPIAAWMLWKNGASPLTNALLCLILLVGLLPLLSSSVFSIVPQLHGEYRRMQKLDFGNAALRLVMIAALAISRMNAWLAASVGAVTNWIELLFNRKWARDHADFSAATNSDDRRDLISISAQSLPNAIFFCFQGQITLLILTLVGTTSDIADVTALGRIAVIFVIFSTVFNNVVAPRFARCQDRARLPRLYFGLVAGSIAMLVPILILAWLYPTPMLWLLGPKYAGLNFECGLVMTTACVSQVCGVMWSMNSNRAWIRYQTRAFVPMILGMQLIAALALDLHRFDDVLIFNLISTAAPLPIYLLDALHGLKVGPIDSPG